jgi:M6 family metalloprotease-like protein
MSKRWLLLSLLFTIHYSLFTASAQQKPCGTSVLTRHREAKALHRALGEGNVANYQGAKRGLIILVDFPDQPFSDDDAKVQWTAIANEHHYSGYKAIGSVADYFRDQSYGQFELSFDVVGPVTMQHEFAYYGKNIDWGDDDWFDGKVDEMVEEACRGVCDSVRFSDYDWDGDGVVEEVFLLYAGHGENDYWNVTEDVVWPHMGSLSIDWNHEKGLLLQDCRIDIYACSNEIKKNNEISGIGTICHEFSHCLGLPDLYDTQKGVSVLGMYDLMDSGDRGGGGWVPTGYSSYERYACGWLTPEPIDDPMTIDSLAPLHLMPDVRFYQDLDFSSAYYLIENRVAESWDVSLPSHGLMVWRIDYNERDWKENEVNSYDGRRRVDRIQLSDIPTAISTPSADVHPVAVYTISPGLYIIKYSDGTTKKCICK